MESLITNSSFRINDTIKIYFIVQKLRDHAGMIVIWSSEASDVTSHCEYPFGIKI